MLVLDPRKLMQFSPNELWSHLTGSFILRMDDGDIETNYKEVLFSRYCWEAHALYPKLPFYKRHLISSVMKHGAVDTKSHARLLSNIHKDILEVYDITDPMKIWELAKLYYKITNNIYNGMITNVSEYVTGMDILDFIEVYKEKDINEAVNNVKPDAKSIKSCYDKIIYSIYNSKEISNNVLVNSVKSGLVRMNNLKQVIGPRGYLDDISGDVFPNPVLSGFLEGLTTVHDSLVESRTASKNLFFSKADLEDAEYFARRLQLQTMVIERIHPGDCGSKSYLHWNIKENDLNLMTGVYYLDEETQTLKYIKDTDKHLVGKTLKIRSPVAGCSHPDPHGVCFTCFGRLALNALTDTNVGHNASTTFTKDTTQIIISTKHFSESSIGQEISFEGKALDFITAKVKDYTAYLKPIKYHSFYRMLISSKEGSGLLDLEDIDNLDEVNYARLTDLSMIVLEFDTNIENIQYPINLTNNNRKPFFTKEFLEYLQIRKWGFNSQKEFVIDLSQWDFSLPVLQYPIKQMNMGEYSKNIASMIESTIANIEERIKPNSAVELLGDLFDVVNERLNIHFSVLGLIVYGSMVRSIEEHDYRLPKTNTSKSLSVSSLNIANRSLSAEMAYENQFEVMGNPVSFFKDNRIDHVMDAFITPYEVSVHYNWYK